MSCPNLSAALWCIYSHRKRLVNNNMDARSKPLFFQCYLRASILIVALCLFGCASTPIEKTRLANANYGPPPPADHQQIIKDKINGHLFDPTSPIYEFETPIKGYTQKSSYFETGESFGWVVCGNVNAKNRYGGYVGRTPFFVLFQTNRIVEFIYGEPPNDGLNVKNKAIFGACNRKVPQ